LSHWCQTLWQLGCADNTCVPATSHNAIQTILNISQIFAAENDVKFNASKSHFLLFNCPINIKDIELSNIPIQVSDICRIHLGYHIGKNYN